MRAEFEKHSGDTFVIMGHVEDGCFVANDPTGQHRLVEILLQDIQRAAIESGCKLVLLGCNSASHNVQAGVILEFNPLDAINVLTQAVQALTDYAFYRALAAEDLNITLLLDQSLLTSRDDKPVGRTVSFAMCSGKIGPIIGSMTTPEFPAVAALVPTLISSVPLSELK